MDSKKFIWIGGFVGSTLGGYIPALWGDSGFSAIAMLTSSIGGILGIWGGFRFSESVGE